MFAAEVWQSIALFHFKAALLWSRSRQDTGHGPVETQKSHERPEVEQVPWFKELSGNCRRYRIWQFNWITHTF